MNKKRYEELLTIIGDNPVCGSYMTNLMELCDLQQDWISKLKAEAVEVKREQGDKSCPLVHCRCGACGVAIHDDGGCGCKDNRRHGIVVHEADRITKFIAEVARYRDALQKVAHMHTSHYENLPRHVIDVQSIIDRSMTPEVATEDTPKAVAADDVDYVLMPRVLTDNPAHHEFRSACVGDVVAHEVVVFCAACNCTGNDRGRKCMLCDGDGKTTVKVYVTWPTIRKIYAMAVKHMAKEA